MGILGLLSKEPAEAEVEQDTDQVGQRNTTNSSPTHIIGAYLRSEDEKRFFGDYEVGADAEPIPIPTNSPRRDDMSGKVNVEGPFKPRNTLQQSLPTFEQPVRTYGKPTGPKRMRTEAIRGDNVPNTEERWNLHGDHKPIKRKKLKAELILISDDEAVTKRDANSVPRREDTPHTRPSLGVGMDPSLARAINGDVPEYSSLEKRMKAGRREKPCSRRTSTPVYRLNPVGIRENPPHPPSQAQSTQVEEISDDEDGATPNTPEEPYKGTSYLIKPRVVKAPDGDGYRQTPQNVKTTGKTSAFFMPRNRHPFGRLAASATLRNSREVLKRAEEVDDSPDVLHNGDNVGIRAQQRVRDRMTANGHSEPVHRSRSPSPRRTYQSSSDIPATTFGASRKNTESPALASTSARKPKTPQGFRLKLKQLIYDYGSLPPGNHKYYLKFDYANGVTFECECKAMQCALSLEGSAFQATKIRRIVHYSTMIQITLSKNGNHDNVILLEVSNPAEADQFLSNIADIKDLRLIEKDGTHMEKIFQNSKKQHHTLRSRQEPKSDVELDQDALRIQRNKERQRLRRGSELIDLQPTAKRRKSESNDCRPSAQRDPTSRSGRYGDAKGNPHETRSKSRPERVAQDTEDYEESQSLGGNYVSEYQETEFSKLKRNQKPWDRPLVFPADGPRKTTVDFGDLERLDEGEFLNDNIIAFYLRYLEQKLEPKHDSTANRVYFFNTFFYERLTSRSSGKKGINYEGVQKWTSKIDIFNFDYVVVPVNESAHWYVAIICNLPNLSRSRSLEQEERESSVEGTEPRDRKSDNLVQVAGPNSRNSSRQSTIADVTDLDHRVAEAREQVAGISLTRGDVGEETDLDSEHIPGDSFEMTAGTDDVEDENWPAPDENPPANAVDGIPSIDYDASYHTENAKIGEGLSRDQAKGQQKSTKQRRKSSLRKYNVDAPIIITLDSLGLAHNVTARNLKEYLVEEGKTKRRLQVSIQDIGAMNSKEIPLQGNFCDCGIYLLIYIEKFLRDPRSFVNRILTREMDQRDDWPNLNPSAKRNDLRNLLLYLYERQNDSRKKEAISRGKYYKGLPSSLVTRGPRHNERRHELLVTDQEANDAQVSKARVSSGLGDLPTVVSSHPNEEQPKFTAGGVELLATPEPEGESHNIELLLEGSSHRIREDHPEELATGEGRANQSSMGSKDPGKVPERHLRRTPRAQDTGNMVLEVAVPTRRIGLIASPRKGPRGQRPSPELNGESIILD
ncbi:MAG: hypothetical protein M1840_006675 [Geoglossum simile]|nr:MAG: hypothetical protein M1840_006675 [Geoglossum simile]